MKAATESSVQEKTYEPIAGNIISVESERSGCPEVLAKGFGCCAGDTVLIAVVLVGGGGGWWVVPVAAAAWVLLADGDGGGARSALECSKAAEASAAELLLHAV